MGADDVEPALVLAELAHQAGVDEVALRRAVEPWAREHLALLRRLSTATAQTVQEPEELVSALVHNEQSGLQAVESLCAQRPAGPCPSGFAQAIADVVFVAVEHPARWRPVWEAPP